MRLLPSVDVGHVPAGQHAHPVRSSATRRAGLLVEHGALPRRDELAVRYNQWTTAALNRVSSDEHRDVVRRYIRW